MADSGIFYGGLPASPVEFQRNEIPLRTWQVHTPPFLIMLLGVGIQLPFHQSYQLPKYRRNLIMYLRCLQKQTEEIKSLKDDNKSLKKEMEILKVQGISTAKKEKLPTGLSVR